MAPFIDGHIAGTTGFPPQRQLKIICPHVHRTHQFATESKALSVGVHRHVPDMRMRTAAMPDGLIFFDSKLKLNQRVKVPIKSSKMEKKKKKNKLKDFKPSSTHHVP